MRLRTYSDRIVTNYLVSSLPEMAGGWGNPLMRKEEEFIVLDGV